LKGHEHPAVGVYPACIMNEFQF